MLLIFVKTHCFISPNIILILLETKASLGHSSITLVEYVTGNDRSYVSKTRGAKKKIEDSKSAKPN